MNTSYMFQFQLKCNELNPLFFFFYYFFLLHVPALVFQEGTGRKTKKDTKSEAVYVCVILGEVT